MDQCNGVSAGSASTDLGAACDVYSLANACERISYDQVAPALNAQQQEEKLCALGPNGVDGAAMVMPWSPQPVQSIQLSQLSKSNVRIWYTSITIDNTEECGVTRLLIGVGAGAGAGVFLPEPEYFYRRFAQDPWDSQDCNLRYHLRYTAP